MDMVGKEEIDEKIRVFSKKIKKKIYTISALKHTGLKNLKQALINYGH